MKRILFMKSEFTGVMTLHMADPSSENVLGDYTRIVSPDEIINGTKASDWPAGMYELSALPPEPHTPES
jgi:hypothetical protein